MCIVLHAAARQTLSLESVTFSVRSCKIVAKRTVVLLHTHVCEKYIFIQLLFSPGTLVLSRLIFFCGGQHLLDGQSSAPAPRRFSSWALGMHHEVLDLFVVLVCLYFEQLDGVDGTSKVTWLFSLKYA